MRPVFLYFWGFVVKNSTKAACGSILMQEEEEGETVSEEE